VNSAGSAHVNIPREHSNLKQKNTYINCLRKYPQLILRITHTNGINSDGTIYLITQRTREAVRCIARAFT